MYSYSELRNEAPVGAPGAAGGAEAAARTRARTGSVHVQCTIVLQYCRQQQRRYIVYNTCTEFSRGARTSTGIQYDCSQRRAAEEPHVSETAPAANKWTSLRMPLLCLVIYKYEAHMRAYVRRRRKNNILSFIG